MTTTTKGTVDTNEINLSDAQNTAIDAAMEQEFQRDPAFLTKLENTLTNVSATSPGTGTAPAAPAAPNNELFAAFDELNKLVDTWLTGFPDAEREQMRLRYFNQITARIKQTLTSKKTAYEAQNTAILNEADKVFGAIHNLGQVIRSNVAILGITSPITDITTLASALNRSNLLPNGTLTMGARSVILNDGTNITDLKNQLNVFKIFLNTFFENELNNIKRTLATPFSPEQEAALTALSGLLNSLEKPFNDYIAVLETNLKHPDTKAPISYQAIKTSAEILERYEKQLTPPGVDHILSRDERFLNIQVAEDTAHPGYYNLYFPIKTPNPDTPYIQGTELTDLDRGNFYAWVHRNKSKLSPEQLEAVEANVEHWRGFIKTNFIDTTLPLLNGVLTAGGDVQEQTKIQVANFLNPTPPLLGIASDRKAEALNLMAMYYKLDTASMTQAKIEKAVKEKMEQELLDRLNLPSEDDHSEALDDVRETYAEEQNDKSRAGVLGATRARVTTEMKKEFKDKDLTKPENRQEFTKTAVNKILQERLNTVNSTMNYKKPKWYQNFPAKLGFDSKKMLIGGGLLGASLLGAAISSGAVGSALTTAYNGVTSTVSSIVGAIPGVSTLATVAKGAGHLTAGVGGYFVGGQLMNMISYGPLSDSQRRTKQEVLGTRDASGASIGGLGSIDRVAGTYTHQPVHNALAAQIAYAEKRGASLATGQDAKDLITGGPANQKTRFDTANHLWKREREGLKAVIDKELSDAMLNPLIKDEEKGNTAIANALNSIYANNGIENNFLKSVAGYRNEANYKSKARVMAGLGVAFGGGLLFNIIL